MANISASNELDINRAAIALGISPLWLKRIIWVESKNDPAAVNSIGATGLIQFVKSTAIDLGTTTEKLRQMLYSQQMDYVIRYFKGKFKSYGKPQNELDMYLIVFYPPLIGKGGNDILPQSAYNSNKGMDAGKDGRITKTDIKNWYEKQAANLSILGSNCK